MNRQSTSTGAYRAKTRAILGLVLAAGISTSARRLGALSRSGAVAATLVGAAVHAGIGTRASIAMITYFTGAAAVGRLPGNLQRVQRRGNQRDAVQVLANGAPAAAFSLLHLRYPDRSDNFAIAAFYGSLASAAADTFATEIGTRWGGPPRSIITGRTVASGESGAVTPAGLAASVLASLAIAVMSQLGGAEWKARATAYATGGAAGSLVDSLLGALFQEQRWCETCGVRTELPVHVCGTRTYRIAGLPGVNNDVVNFLAAIAGGIIAVALSAALPRLTARDGSRVEFVATPTSSQTPAYLGEP